MTTYDIVGYTSYDLAEDPVSIFTYYNEASAQEALLEIVNMAPTWLTMQLPGAGGAVASFRADSFVRLAVRPTNG